MGHGYPTDLADEHWALLEPLIPPAKPGGRPRTTNVSATSAPFFPIPFP